MGNGNPNYMGNGSQNQMGNGSQPKDGNELLPDQAPRRRFAQLTGLCVPDHAPQWARLVPAHDGPAALLARMPSSN